MSADRIGRIGRRYAAALLRLALMLAAVYALWLAQSWQAARAEDGLWLSGTVGSYHFERSRDYNERNWGLGLEYGVARNTRIVGGVYRNSMYERSTYLGGTWTPLEIGPARAGLLAGVVNGYPGANDGGFFPMGALLGALERGRVGVNLLAAPSWKGSPAVLALQIKFRIN